MFGELCFMLWKTKEIFQERYWIYNRDLQAMPDLALAWLLHLSELFPNTLSLATPLQS